MNYVENIKISATRIHKDYALLPSSAWSETGFYHAGCWQYRAYCCERRHHWQVARSPSLVYDNLCSTHKIFTHVLSRGFLKEILELHKRGGLGMEVPQRGPGRSPGRGSGDEVPYKLKHIVVYCNKFLCHF